MTLWTEICKLIALPSYFVLVKISLSDRSGGKGIASYWELLFFGVDNGTSKHSQASAYSRRACCSIVTGDRMSCLHCSRNNNFLWLQVFYMTTLSSICQIWNGHLWNNATCFVSNQNSSCNSCVLVVVVSHINPPVTRQRQTLTVSWTIRTLFIAFTILHDWRNPHLLRSFQWSNVPEFAACSKPPSRDNHRIASYRRTQQRDQGGVEPRSCD